MAAIIKGCVFNDLNYNGHHEAQEPGILGVDIMLIDPFGSRKVVKTDSKGWFVFGNICVSGAYDIYEVAVYSPFDSQQFMVQPECFMVSTTRRYDCILITDDVIEHNEIIPTIHFGHSSSYMFLVSSIGYRIQEKLGIATLYKIDVQTGDEIPIANLSNTSVCDNLEEFNRTSIDTKMLTEQVEDFGELNANLEVIKNVDNKCVVSGDIVTFLVELKNMGNVKLIDIVLKEDFSYTLQEVQDTTTIHGQLETGKSVVKGLEVGSIEVGDSVVVTYQAKVHGGSDCNLLKNAARAEYRFLDQNSICCMCETDEVTADIQFDTSCFKQILLNSSFKVPEMKPPIEEIDSTVTDVQIVKFYSVKTCRGTSKEGQKLTGHKLIVHGLLKCVIEYTANIKEQSVHSVHYDIPFSTYIVLKNNFDEDDTVELTPVIEDSNAIKIGEKDIKICVALLLIASVIH